MYQVNFTVPAAVQGSVPVVLSIGGQSSNSVTLPLFGISAVVNAASFLNTGTAAPEEMVSIFANGLGSANELTGIFPATSAQGVPSPSMALLPRSSLWRQLEASST